LQKGFLRPKKKDSLALERSYHQRSNESIEDKKEISFFTPGKLKFDKI